MHHRREGRLQGPLYSAQFPVSRQPSDNLELPAYRSWVEFSTWYQEEPMLNDLFYRLRALFRGEEMDAEADEELRQCGGHCTWLRV